MARVEDFPDREFPPRLPLGGMYHLIVNTVAILPLPWGDRKGPPNYRRTAVGLYDWPEKSNRWQALSVKVIHWARGTERFIVDIKHNKITF